MRFTLFALALASLAAACVNTDLGAPEFTQSVPVAAQVSEAHETVFGTTSNPKIKQGYVDAPEGQIHFWQAGQGPALLMIHQASSSSEEFAGVVDTLATDFQVISFDWPGHGLSDDPKTELGADEFTLSALRVLDHLGLEKAHIVGNHGGALIAMNLAWKHPERVDRVILSGTSGVKDMDAVQEFSDDLGLDEMNVIDRDGKSLGDAWGRYTRYMPNSTPGEVLVAYMNNITVRLRPYDAHYGILRFDRRPALQSMAETRVLLMQAEHDPFVSDQESLLQILKNAERVVLEDVGVFNFFENPVQSAEAIHAFLSKP